MKKKAKKNKRDNSSFCMTFKLLLFLDRQIVQIKASGLKSLVRFCYHADWFKPYRIGHNQ